MKQLGNQPKCDCGKRMIYFNGNCFIKSSSVVGVAVQVKVLNGSRLIWTIVLDAVFWFTAYSIVASGLKDCN